MSDVRRYFVNSAYNLGGQVVSQSITAIAYLLLARHIGPTSFGVFSVALAVGNMFMFFTDLGLTHTFIREASAGDGRIHSLVATTLKLRLALILLLTVASGAVAAGFYSDPSLRLAILFVCPGQIASGSLQSAAAAFLMSGEQMRRNAVHVTAVSLVRATAICVALFMGRDPLRACALFGASGIVGALISLAFVKVGLKEWGSWDRSIMKGLVFFSIAGAITVLLPQIGPIVLESVGTLDAVGHYSAAARVASYLYLLPSAIGIAFYPSLFRLVRSDRDQYLSVCRMEISLIGFVAVSLCMPVVLSSSAITRVLFGSGWAGETERCVGVLALAMMIHSVNHPLADLLTVDGRQAIRSLVMVGALIMAVCLLVVLGKRYGAVGGAVSVLLTEGVLLLGFVATQPSSLQLLASALARPTVVGLFLVCLSRALSGGGLTGEAMLATMFVASLILFLLFERETRRTVLNVLARRRGYRSTR